jgi:FixJ family two-component response regulator
VQSEPLVFILARSPRSRESLVGLVESSGLTARELAEPMELIQGSDRHHPACVIADIGTEGIAGLQRIEPLLTTGGAPAVIVVADTKDVSTAVRAMKLGVVDFLARPFSEQGLLDAVSEALRRDAGALREQAARTRFAALVQQLTPRERQVMHLIVAGLANKQIAADLGISEKTVEVHRKRIMRKLRVKCVIDLVRLVLTNHLDGSGST